MLGGGRGQVFACARHVDGRAASPPRGDARPTGWDGIRLFSLALRGWDSLSEFRLKDADNLREIHLGGCSRLQLVRVRAHSDLHPTIRLP